MDTGSLSSAAELIQIRKPFDPNGTVNVTFPAPCHFLGKVELVYMYFGSGFMIPILALIYIQLAFLKRTILGKLRQHDLVCLKNSAEDEISENVDDFNVQAVEINRIELLMAAKAKRSRFRVFLAEAASPQTTLGQILMSTAIISSILSLSVYLFNVSSLQPSLEFCGTMLNFYQFIDFVANLYLLFYFGVRLLGNDKKMDIVLNSFHSTVDYFTIPAVLLSVLLDRYFTGFSFLRAYNLLWIVDILACRGIFRKVNTVRLAKLFLLVASVLIISAGFLHLVENIGDPWILNSKTSYNGQLVTFWRCFLYLYGRVSLLDLSGIRIQTMSGRIIIYGFQILALGIVSKAIPELIVLMRIIPEWEKNYALSPSFLHIIVCGHVKVSSLTSFLSEFYSNDRDTSEFFRIVILDDDEPGDEMKQLLETYFNKLDYRRGSCMKLSDLTRVKLVEAEAILILAEGSSDADSEDAENIMRVVSIKNYKPHARVIVQILQYHNKIYLHSIPSWNPRRGDIIICIAEISLGLLAQSCSAPGFSTLIANFFTTRSFDPKTKAYEKWMVDYMRGASKELYGRIFSSSFVGLDFARACELCYRHLRIVLLAIDFTPNEASSTPEINPPGNQVIREGSCGFFIASSIEEVDRVRFYCRICHCDVEDPQSVKQCSCHVVSPTPRKTTLRRLIGQKSISRTLSYRRNSDLESKIHSFISQYPNTPFEDRAPPFRPGPSVKTDILYDSTGMFYWRPPESLSTLILTRQTAAMTDFTNHVVVCILTEKASEPIGLASLLLPLRSSTIREEDLREIVILGDPEFLKREWPFIRNIPKVKVVKGSALNRFDLRAVGLDTCQMCVILGASAPTNPKDSADQSLVDKSVILATLNVRAMRFPKGQSQNRISGAEVPLITMLSRDTNVQFLEQDDADMPGSEFYLTEPYAGGRAFAASVLDLLMVTSFFNPPIVRVFNTLIFGGASVELENILSEGAGLIGGADISKAAVVKGQVTICQLSLLSGPLAQYADSVYGNLFLDALIFKGLLMLGLFRKVDLLDVENKKRFVICNPPENFQLHPSDEVFALRRLDWRPEVAQRQPTKVGSLAAFPEF